MLPHHFRHPDRLPARVVAAALLLLAGGWIAGARPRRLGAGATCWSPGVARAVAVHGGRALFRVPTAAPTSETLVVVSALTRASGPYPLRLSARPVDRAEEPAPAGDPPPAVPPQAAPELPSPSAPGHGLPPREQVFHMLVRPGDLASPSNYAPIRSVLKAVGRRVQVYVARADADRVGDDLLEDLIVTFDDRIHPVAAGCFGTARDVDGDGRFTILLSSDLDHLGGGRHAVDGFVKGADLDSSVPAPFGNHCDMMYLNTALRAGPYLRTIVAHEYMHAVVASQKRLRPAGTAGDCLEEEGWLDEAMAHLAEDFHGFATSNIDYRVSAFLSCPERYQLVVEDYFAADLLRSHGHRGSTYLFLRWCVDRYGPGLLPALVRSDRRGIDNLEAATGSRFADLYRRWSLALFRSGMDPMSARPAAGDDGYRGLNLRAPYGEWELAGPRYGRVIPGGPAECWQAAGTSSHFVLVQGSAAGAVEIEVVGPAEAQVQVTALPLEADRPRLDLALETTRAADGSLGIRARVAERHGVAVRLSGLSWERQTPGPNPHASDFRPGRLDQIGVAAAFGTAAVPAGGELTSGPIPLTGISDQTGQLVIKVLGTDPRGRPVSAWAELNPQAGPEPIGHPGGELDPLVGPG
ncbi:MAG TPA: hypothetical protein VFF52_15840 [Isosphaeraceae bacterium]|nr:hypothetical protein [Isosphaeraceae bacterium]